MNRQLAVCLGWLIFVGGVAAQEPIFAPGAKLKVEAEGGVGGEGPVWHPKQGVFSSGNGHVNLLTLKGEPTIAAKDAGTNGLLFDAEGRLVACDSKLRRITRTDADGKLTVLTDRYDGKRYNTPNDLTVDSLGRIYFTDPRYGKRDDLEIRDDKGQAIEGVYRIDRDGKVTRIIGRELERPNGILVSPDDRHLFVADNNNDTKGGARKLWRFDLKKDGSVDLASKKLLHDWGMGRGPDGLKQDQQGRLYVAGGLNKPNPPFEPAADVKGGIYVFTPEGKQLDFLAVPTDEVTNCAFGGADLKTLYITGGGTLYSIRTTTPGRVIYPSGAKAGMGPWKLDELRRAPKVTVVEESKGGVSALYYESEPVQGKPTRVFAYLARPEKADGKLPAMVLVHGGGGTAFKEWAELWAKRGYVALAMDLAGCGPDRKRLPDGGPGQGDDVKFGGGGSEQPTDFWTYHAVASVIRGASLLAARPDVDAERIGVTGISWGGYLTCIVAGLDDRFTAAVPVYGCGFIHENSTWNGIFEKMTPAKRQFWVTHFDPSRYVGQAKMPVLFVNGTNDFAYPLDSYQKTYREVKQRDLCVTVNMPHGHPQGWAPVEIGLYVDQFVKGGKPLAKITSSQRDGARAEVKFKADVPVTSAGLHYTTDTGKWQQRKWQTVPAKLDGTTATAEIPTARPLVYFLTLTDERKATVSTEHETLEK